MVLVMDLFLASDAIRWYWQPPIFFGLYFASFIHCVRWLLFEDEGWRIRQKINWWLGTMTFLVFSLSTVMFFAVAMRSICSTDPINSDCGSVPIETLFGYVLASTALRSSAIQWSILMLIDSVMIYRCWIVFSKNWFIICFPVVLWCFCLTCEILSFYCEMGIDLEDARIDVSESAMDFCLNMSWTPLAFFVCTIVVNIYTTSALVYKIWRAAKNNGSTNRLYRTCRILTESGILYTLSSLVYMISWILIYNPFLYMDPASALLAVPLGLQMMLCLLMFMPGIAFNLVIIRIGEQRAKGEDSWVDMGASSTLVPSELLKNADTSAQGKTGQDSHEGMDGEVMEINEMEAEEIMEVLRTRELETGVN